MKERTMAHLFVKADNYEQVDAWLDRADVVSVVYIGDGEYKLSGDRIAVEMVADARGYDYDEIEEV
jgi:hypothetical protein